MKQEKMKQEKKKLDNQYEAYQMYPLAMKHKKEEKTNVSIPSDYQVQAAKDWVDSNEK